MSEPRTLREILRDNKAPRVRALSWFANSWADIDAVRNGRAWGRSDNGQEVSFVLDQPIWTELKRRTI